MTYIQPGLPLLLAAVVLAAALSRRHRTRNVLLAAASLLLWAWPPAAWLFAGTLEWRYPAGAALPDADAIVVLGGAILPPNPSQPELLAATDTRLRCEYAAWLFHHGHRAPVVASGGPATGGIISAAMRGVLERAGVPKDMVLTEERSTSTYENAVRTAELLGGRGARRILLVTEAYHMARAERCFQKQGLAVVPAPCCFRTLQLQSDWKRFIPSARAILSNEDTLHEWVALAWYKITGRI